MLISLIPCQLGALFHIGSDPYLDFTRMADKYGQVYSMWLGSRLVVVLNGAKTIRNALQKRSLIFAGRPSFHTFKILSGHNSGLVFSDYSRRWAIVKKVCSTAIHRYVTTPDLLESKLEEECHRLLNFFKEQRGKPFDPCFILRMALANVILKVIFDTTFHYDHKELREILEISDAFRDSLGPGKAIDFLPWFRFFPSKDLIQLNLLYAKLMCLIKKLFIENRATYNDGKIRNLADSLEKVIEMETKKSLENGTVLEFDESVSLWSLFDMFGAGFDTTAVMLLWSIGYLVKYKHVQYAIQAEIDSVIGNERVTMKNVKQLHFLRATVYELLRITSISTMSVPHSTTADTNIAGYSIPKGTVIFPNLWSASHDPNEWENPEVFNPQRFLDDQGHVVQVDTNPNFIVFSAGRRKCPGSELAVLEMSMFLATLLQSCRFTQEGLESKYQGIELTPIAGLTNKPRTFYINVEVRKEDERSKRCKA